MHIKTSIITHGDAQVSYWIRFRDWNPSWAIGVPVLETQELGFCCIQTAYYFPQATFIRRPTYVADSQPLQSSVSSQRLLDRLRN